MKFPRKMWLIIILKIMKSQCFIVSLEDKFFEKPKEDEGMGGGRGEIDPLNHFRDKCHLLNELSLCILRNTCNIGETFLMSVNWQQSANFWFCDQYSKTKVLSFKIVNILTRGVSVENKNIFSWFSCLQYNLSFFFTLSSMNIWKRFWKTLRKTLAKHSNF